MSVVFWSKSVKWIVTDVINWGLLYKLVKNVDKYSGTYQLTLVSWQNWHYNLHLVDIISLSRSEILILNTSCCDTTITNNRYVDCFRAIDSTWNNVPCFPAYQIVGKFFINNLFSKLRKLRFNKTPIKKRIIHYRSYFNTFLVRPVMNHQEFFRVKRFKQLALRKLNFNIETPKKNLKILF